MRPSPPRWPRTMLHVTLPHDSMRDAIIGDLHEEFVHDIEQVGVAHAQARYWRRCAGIFAHAMFDIARLRAWASTAPLGQAVPVAHAIPARSSGVRRSDIGIGAVALGLLFVGVIVNTVLFSNVRHGTTPNAALGVAAIVLAVVCAGGAAVILCAGPRWLRRRIQRRRSCE